MIKKILIKIINLYQKTISPDHGAINLGFFTKPTCRFSPTCSQYTKESIKKFGAVNGIILGIKRLTKCHPLNKGGFDPIPQRL